MSGIKPSVEGFDVRDNAVLKGLMSGIKHSGLRQVCASLYDMTMASVVAF